VHRVGFHYTDVSRCTVNKTFKKLRVSSDGTAKRKNEVMWAC